MQAITFDAFGPPEVLRISSLSVPRPGPGETVIRVAASSINPTDLLMRNGAQASLMVGLKPPFIAGMEFSGHVHEAGSGVSIPEGTPVIGVVNPRRPAGGAHAQFIRTPASSIAPLAPSVDLIGAATVPMNALTATLALGLLNLPRGSSVLVTGGAGMLGGFAIQLAKRSGLIIVANCGEGDAQLMRDFGADVVLPRDDGMKEALRARFPGGVDGLIDGALIGAVVSGLVRDGGGAVALRRSHPINDERLSKHYVSVLDGMERADILRAIAGDLEEGVLKARVAEGGRFSYRDAVQAHRKAETGKMRGRVVVTFEH